MKDQLLIDKAILRDCKRRHINLTNTWIDCQKVYDLIPPFGDIKVSGHLWKNNTREFIQQSIESSKVELTSCGKMLRLQSCGGFFKVATYYHFNLSCT